MATKIEREPLVALGIGVALVGVVLLLIKKKPPFDPWSYDFNGNGIIETSELLAAANDYDAGIITKNQMEQVRALWLG